MEIHCLKSHSPISKVTYLEDGVHLGETRCSTLRPFSVPWHTRSECSGSNTLISFRPSTMVHLVVRQTHMNPTCLLQYLYTPYPSFPLSFSCPSSHSPTLFYRRNNTVTMTQMSEMNTSSTSLPSYHAQTEVPPDYSTAAEDLTAPQRAYIVQQREALENLNVKPAPIKPSGETNDIEAQGTTATPDDASDADIDTARRRQRSLCLTTSRPRSNLPIPTKIRGASAN